jgi:hypothetical protein
MVRLHRLVPASSYRAAAMLDVRCGSDQDVASGSCSPLAIVD